MTGWWGNQGEWNRRRDNRTYRYKERSATGRFVENRHTRIAREDYLLIFSIGFPFASSSTSLSSCRIFFIRGS